MFLLRVPYHHGAHPLYCALGFNDVLRLGHHGHVTCCLPLIEPRASLNGCSSLCFSIQNHCLHVTASGAWDCLIRCRYGNLHALMRTSSKFACSLPERSHSATGLASYAWMHVPLLKACSSSCNLQCVRKQPSRQHRHMCSASERLACAALHATCKFPRVVSCHTIPIKKKL